MVTRFGFARNEIQGAVDTPRENFVTRLATCARLALVIVCATASSMASGQDLKKGDRVQTLANLHPDRQRHVLYTLNYQLLALIPVCSNVTITKVAKKKLAFDYNGQEFEVGYEGFTEGAGVSFQKAVQSIYFGAACDSARLQSLGKIDQEGIRMGQPRVGMTREGVLFAMGRPPFHANPDLNVPAWRYWKNRFGQTIVNFGDDGKVTSIQ